MNNKSYKKLRKEDKNKKRLKTNLKNVTSKTNLPKGQNLTDTNFKVKKIVIKDQVKPHEPGELLYHQKLNITELAARLNHHNSSIKLDALEGLKTLITNHPGEILMSHYVQLIDVVVKLILDSLASVRRSSCKILTQLFSIVPQDKLVSIFASLNSYLLCGLTHIDRGIREDSLVLMDSYLKYLPELCRKYAFNLLTVCLDLISEKNTGTRTLSLNLENSQVTTKWRIKVLERIRALLTSLFKAPENLPVPSEENLDTEKTFVPGEVNFFPIYTTCNLICDTFCLDVKNTEQGNNILTPFSFSEALIPLLLCMFLEVDRVESAPEENNTTSVIDEESSKLLSLIVCIMQSLWDLINSSSNTKSSLRVLSDKFTRPILQTLIIGKFPYSIITRGTGKAKYALNEYDSTSKLSTNLSLVRLVFSFTRSKNWNHVVPYLKNCFRLIQQFTPFDNSTFADCVLRISREQNFPDTSYFFSKVVNVSLEGNSPLYPHFFRLLGKIALDPSMNHFHKDPDFEKWLASLPEKLTVPKIYPYQLEIISKIAVAGFPSFSKSLDVNIELILDTIPNVTVDEGRRELVHWQMATLLQWVKDWDDELTESLMTAVQNCYWGERLTKYIAEIIAVKSILQ